MVDSVKKHLCVVTKELIEDGEDNLGFFNHLNSCSPCNSAVHEEAYTHAPQWAKDFMDGKLSTQEALRVRKASKI